MKETKEDNSDNFPAVNTESIPDVFLGISNREEVVEKLMEMLANPPDEIIIIHRKNGGSFDAFFSGYRSLISLLGGIEFLKQIMLWKYRGDGI